MDMVSLPKAGELARNASRTRHWRPGLGTAQHSELFASTREAGGVAAALALALDALSVSGRVSGCGSGGSKEGGAEGVSDGRNNVLWVQDAASLRLTGRPYRPGLPAALRRRVIHVVAAKPEDALFALEEGVRCRDLACVIGEIVGNPRALDFTASRRLSLAAEKHGVPLFLVRLDADRDLSSARMRWQIRSAASSPPRWNEAAPGIPAWHCELFRARIHAPGEWILCDDGTALAARRPPVAERASAAEACAAAPDHGDLAGTVGDGSLAAF